MTWKPRELLIPSIGALEKALTVRILRFGALVSDPLEHGGFGPLGQPEPR